MTVVFLVLLFYFILIDWLLQLWLCQNVHLRTEKIGKSHLNYPWRNFLPLFRNIKEYNVGDASYFQEVLRWLVYWFIKQNYCDLFILLGTEDAVGKQAQFMSSWCLGLSGKPDIEKVIANVRTVTKIKVQRAVETSLGLRRQGRLPGGSGFQEEVHSPVNN